MFYHLKFIGILHHSINPSLLVNFTIKVHGTMFVMIASRITAERKVGQAVQQVGHNAMV